jgi:curved DNA-binding protein CbpA
MQKPRTHYDNLKVPRNATPKAIRAAYKRLALLYHPDKNPNSQDANRIMQIINASYAVLSDSLRRAEHDQWIARIDAVAAATTARAATAGPRSPEARAAAARAGAARARAAHWPDERTTTTPSPVYRESMLDWPALLIRVLPFLLLFIAQAFIRSGNQPSFNRPSENSRSVELPAYYPQNTYNRPAVAPNGVRWPKNAAEIPGFPVARTKGYGRVTIDNSDNSSDVYVKLVSLEGTTRQSVRHIFIPALSACTCKSIAPGDYDLRYKNLDTGAARKSPKFIFVGDRRGDDQVTIPLYHSSTGDPFDQPIAESEFADRPNVNEGYSR